MTRNRLEKSVRFPSPIRHSVGLLFFNDYALATEGPVHLRNNGPTDGHWLLCTAVQPGRAVGYCHKTRKSCRQQAAEDAQLSFLYTV